jgi:lipoprotein-anchoring transpeptidase ErfK/SrfK
VSIVINLSSQRALLYRDGMLVAVSTISTGSEGRETPTGTFTILQKEVVHRSRTYDDAPMPFMQRLTWKGVSMHAGNLPGYPASHGCIRLPARFAKLLFAVTTIGTPVTIRDDADTDIVDGTDQGSPAEAGSSEAQRR